MHVRMKAPTKRLFLAVIALLIGGISQVCGQTLPILTSVNAEAAVSQSSGDILTYSYKISNPSQNTGSLWLLTLDIRKAPNGLVLSSEGLISDDRLTTSTSLLTLNRLRDELVPVGVLSPLN